MVRSGNPNSDRALLKVKPGLAADNPPSPNATSTPRPTFDNFRTTNSDVMNLCAELFRHYRNTFVYILLCWRHHFSCDVMSSVKICAIYLKIQCFIRKRFKAVVLLILSYIFEICKTISWYYTYYTGLQKCFENPGIFHLEIRKTGGFYKNRGNRNRAVSKFAKMFQFTKQGVGQISCQWLYYYRSMFI